MSERAGETAARSSAVLAVANETSANVQTITAAAEELAASIAELGGQVAHSSAIAQGAVEQARRTNQSVDGLAAAAQKIGEVVTLIQTIAGQTNLPPLMFRNSRYIRCLRRYLSDLTRGIPMILQS